MSKPLIVVFGGTGYLGMHIVHALAVAGYQVRVASRHAVTRNLPPGAEKVTADILQPESVAQAVSGADGVVNAVSLYVQSRVLGFKDVHVDGAERLAACCARSGVPALVHISGINANTRSRSPYVSARGLGEQRVREAFPQATILRPSVLFGSGAGLMATLDSLCRLPAIPLFGQGRTRLQPVHVADVARAVSSVLANPQFQGEVYELGGGQVMSYRQLVTLALERRGKHRPLVPVPFALWHAGAAMLSVMKSPPLTRDQLVLMESDNVVHDQVAGFEQLGVSPRGVIESNPAAPGR